MKKTAAKNSRLKKKVKEFFISVFFVVLEINVLAARFSLAGLSSSFEGYA
jgi:hypothetical protein